MEIALICIAHIALFFPFVVMHKSFRVDFQSSGTWSKDETLVFNGEIPGLREFTSCHWEKDTYFANEFTCIWSYCFSEKTGETNRKCVQLYYKGDRQVANREVIFGGYFSGWTKKPIDIRLRVSSFKHRTWNHFCWTYSSLTGRSSLFYNGDLVADEKFANDTERPRVPGTKDVNKHLFVIGQEPDSLEGDYSEDQALFGSISEFNLWDYIVDRDHIYGAANCTMISKGNIIRWDEKMFHIKRLTKTIMKSTKEFCEPQQDHVVFPEIHSKASAQEICTSHGGTLVFPKSKLEDQNVLKTMKDHNKKCIPSKRAYSNIGKLIWLGSQSSSRSWWEDNRDIMALTNYSNWIPSFKELNVPEKKEGCAFIKTNGFWAYAVDGCLDIALCFICSIPRSTVLTLKGTCKLGSAFQWNFYPVINSKSQLSSFEGYKRGQRIVKTDGAWLLEVEGARIVLDKDVASPIGRNQWNWYERSCQSRESQKRNLTLSVCRVGQDFTCDSGQCIELRNRCDNKVDCTADRSDEKYCARVHVPEEYNKNDPPTRKVNGEDVIMTHLVLNIEKINNIDTKNMFIQVTFCITIWWIEPRLFFKNLDQNDKNFINDVDSSKMWIPLDNLEHKNAIIGEIRPDLNRKIEVVLNYLNKTFSHPEPVDLSESLEEYRYLREENLLKIEQRFRVNYECIFDLLKYPFDEQHCNITLKFGSLGNKKMAFKMTNDTIKYTGSDIATRLKVTNTTSNISSYTAPSCSLLPNAYNPCRPLAKYVTVTKDAVSFSLHLKRAPLHHIKTIFIPCMGLWLIAYLTSLLRVNDFTNRNRISVTVLLALVTLFGATSSTDDYPQTTYLKYIDVWFLFYLSSILLIIIHHIAMEMLWHDPNKVVLASNNSVGDMYDGEARKEKHDKQRYLKRISTIFFPVTMIIFNVVYFLLIK